MNVLDLIFQGDTVLIRSGGIEITVRILPDGSGEVRGNGIIMGGIYSESSEVPHERT